MSQLLIDTDILIDFLRGDKQAVSHCKSQADRICFSAITVSEIYAGSKEDSDVEQLFSIFPVIEVTHEIAREGGKLVKHYRSSHSVEIPDAIIAATCMISGFALHTLNIKHFPMFKGLKPPYVKQTKSTTQNI